MMPLWSSVEPRVSWQLMNNLLPSGRQAKKKSWILFHTCILVSKEMAQHFVYLSRPNHGNREGNLATVSYVMN